MSSEMGFTFKSKNGQEFCLKIERTDESKIEFYVYATRHYVNEQKEIEILMLETTNAMPVENMMEVSRMLYEMSDFIKN